VASSSESCWLVRWSAIRVPCWRRANGKPGSTHREMVIGCCTELQPFTRSHVGLCHSHLSFARRLATGAAPGSGRWSGKGSGPKRRCRCCEAYRAEKVMFERYRRKARRVIFFARYEASQFRQPYIETEHLLLGLLREEQKPWRTASCGALRRSIRSASRSRAPLPSARRSPLPWTCL